MLRMGRLTDYGTVILAHLAQTDSGVLQTTNDVAEKTHLALTTVSKLLKIMTRAGLIDSFRGATGGYRLARPASEITAAQIIDAFEGPVSITECSAETHSCDLATSCGVGTAWQKINIAIREGLDEITLEQLAQPGAKLRRFDLTGETATTRRAH